MEKNRKTRPLNELKRIRWSPNGDVARSLRQWRKKFSKEEILLLLEDADRQHDRETARRALASSKAARRKTAKTK